MIGAQFQVHLLDLKRWTINEPRKRGQKLGHRCGRTDTPTDHTANRMTDGAKERTKGPTIGRTRRTD